MRSFSEFLIESQTDKLHRLLRHYGYKPNETGGYTHPELKSSATVSNDGWTHTANGKTKKGKSRNALDNHLAVLHQANLF